MPDQENKLSGLELLKKPEEEIQPKGIELTSRFDVERGARGSSSESEESIGEEAIIIFRKNVHRVRKGAKWGETEIE